MLKQQLDYEEGTKPLDSVLRRYENRSLIQEIIANIDVPFSVALWVTRLTRVRRVPLVLEAPKLKSVEAVNCLREYQARLS